MCLRAAVVFVLPFLASPVAGQTPGPADELPRPEQAAPPAERPVPGTTSGAPPQQPLSEKLHEQEGVLKPPAGLDPGIKRPAPDPNPEPGRGPVITPPGEPGGDQSVQPK